MGKQLGKGGFSTVYMGRHKVLGEDRAIKVIKKSHDPSAIEMFQYELAILKELDHPNIIRLYEVFESKDFAYLVQE